MWIKLSGSILGKISLCGLQAIKLWEFSRPPWNSLFLRGNREALSSPKGSWKAIKGCWFPTAGYLNFSFYTRRKEGLIDYIVWEKNKDILNDLAHGFFFLNLEHYISGLYQDGLWCPMVIEYQKIKTVIFFFSHNKTFFPSSEGSWENNKSKKKKNILEKKNTFFNWKKLKMVIWSSTLNVRIQSFINTYDV